MSCSEVALGFGRNLLKLDGNLRLRSLQIAAYNVGVFKCNQDLMSFPLLKLRAVDSKTP